MALKTMQVMINMDVKHTINHNLDLMGQNIYRCSFSVGLVKRYGR